MFIVNLEGGGWAGGVYEQSGCPSTCVGTFRKCFLTPDNHTDIQNTDFVDNNPASFVDAYFDFASIRVYSTDDDSSPETLSSSGVIIDGPLLVS